MADLLAYWVAVQVWQLACLSGAGMVLGGVVGFAYGRAVERGHM